MDKRGILIAVSSLILLALAFSVDGDFWSDVTSSNQGGAAGILSLFGKFLFEDLPNAQNGYGIRFLFFILLFTLFNFGINRVIPGRTASIVGFVVSLMVVILIPAEVIIKITSLYSSIIVIALGLLLPMYLLFYVRTHWFAGAAGFQRLLRGVVSVILFLVLIWFVNNMSSLMRITS